ncbi:ABC-F family ATP-binding cassette domain-containing protein [Xylella fastidiosa subsp. multiplex]|uniref:ABC-F family ATP-binding cassette domain-containing protein n=1 Tax=Xylella fastidiosa TaxID=2371 RepID=UPI0011936A6F|nr:ABC-F family ATP-binding cassette domain-containing protein [Xylella fastidiosa]MBS9446024.1 ABC-F family ATP-binding cassette domain-containing protein [Xylella fastidiosa subsp. multiplex]MBS9447973.1 ABC-F family ATP-binding cassette domain-containing protein [Xylella fastidiosa subsp. multiplex]MBS9449996.1 ABC-F family ATP-binding cassette domain-containing protein [Xylella fastidiosa subsp. multiplex]MBS9451949.1 ABC-F family ATP-binding cassette domain-containing protein [Xylella fast
MISLRHFAMRRGGRLLLSNVDITLHAGDRVGVVGRNGVGKSSLFAAIRGELEADKGNVELPGKLRIASVAQETPSLSDLALDFVLSGDDVVAEVLRVEAEANAREDWEAVAAAHQRLAEIGGYDAEARAGKLLHGLGFITQTQRRAVSTFSGGWRVRLNLARALMMPSDLLLLDEPTNHLDMDAVFWLEQWLQKYPGTLLLISHDREFLDNVATHILHLHDGNAKLYVGGYTDFERQRAEQLRQQQIAFEKEQAERVHLQSFIDRFKAKASKAKQAQSRIKRLEKLAGTEAVRMEREFRITFAPPTKLPHSLITLRQVNCGYSVLSPSTPSDPPPVDIHAAAPSQHAVILHRVDFGLEAGDRIGLLGPNGAGKSTLVKTLVSDLAPLTGERIAHPDVRIGYFAQHTVESLHEGQSPIDHFRTLAPQAPIQSIRDFLGKWNFPGDRAFEPVDGFSGGERARLALSLIAWRQPNVLLLDEPTNHLDLEMREALAEALSDFDGAIVMVSHDRHLIGLVCDTFWRVADGVVEPFAGDLDQYAAWLRTRPAARGVRAKTEEVNQPQASLTAKSPASQLPVKKSVNSQKLLVAEKHVSELETLLAELDRKLADPVNYANGEVMRRLGDEREHAARRLAEAEQAWLLLMDGG